MACDFDIPIDRRGTNSLKWDFAKSRKKNEGLLPMWVADMDFAAPPEVLNALAGVIGHGVFGYTEVEQSYYDTVSAWFKIKYGFHFGKYDVIKMPGVVFALAAAVRAFTEPGGGVLIQTPVYYPFYEIIRDNGREIVTNPLKYENGIYTVDFDDFEQKIKRRNVKLFILCNPHNPVGRVFTKQELTQIRDICERYGVLVVSDEIHCDFVWPKASHICFGTLSDDAVIATAPSKTFNLAGLQVANIVVKNAQLRSKLKKELCKTGYSQLNTVGLAACQSAYACGANWLDELKVYIYNNINLTREFLKTRLTKVKLVEPQGTYLLWLDFSAYGLSQKELDGFVENRAKLWLDSGTMFGAEGEGFQRMNVACPKSVLVEALDRLEKAFAHL
jgi:cystathionine beta-lyase